MPRGGSRPGSGQKKKKVSVPVELLSPQAAQALGASPSPASVRPAPSAAGPLSDPVTRDQLLIKLNEVALAGDPQALRLALIELPKVDLAIEQTRNLRLRNVALRDLLLKKGLPLEEQDLEFDPVEDPIAKPQALKVVGK